MRVTRLNVFPLKSCAGMSVAHAVLTPRGLHGDRRWMLVDDEGTFVSQRTLPALATLRATPQEGGLELAIAGERIRVPEPAADASRIGVSIWKSELEAPVLGPHVASWLSKRLGTSLRLVHMPHDVVRPVDPERGLEGDHVSFADGYPVLIVNEASLSDLNARIERSGGAGVPIERFRGNIIVSGSEPFEEDSWHTVRVGGVELEVTHGCTRCSMTTVGQSSGIVRGTEPLATLATFRRREDGEVTFGVNAIPRALGPIRVGDEVRPVGDAQPDAPGG